MKSILILLLFVLNLRVYAYNTVDNEVNELYFLPWFHNVFSVRKDQGKHIDNHFIDEAAFTGVKNVTKWPFKGTKETIDELGLKGWGQRLIKAELILHQHVKVVKKSIFNKSSHILIQCWEDITIFFALFYLVTPDY